MGRSESAVTQEWTWRIGPEATEHRLAFLRWNVWSFLLGWTGIILVAVGGRLGVPAIWVPGLVALAFGLALWVKATVEIRRMLRAMSKALGVRVGWRAGRGKVSGPPRTVAHYLAWCEQTGLQPYPFRPAEDTPQRAEVQT